MKRKLVMAGILVTAVMAAACGARGAKPSTPSAAASVRPSSPARISILSPHNGQTIRSRSLPIHLSLKNARIVKPTTSNINPRKGHIHVSLDGSIVSMNYGLKDTIHNLSPGTHTLRVEFVASDHLPFNPRVFQEVAFVVKP
ncbi:MAG: DUF4399 domain-containing protein [Actinomycetota bacterium]|nr:DUF4399 domain-containing protein [Actinomycetota bacterium]